MSGTPLGCDEDFSRAMYDEHAPALTAYIQRLLRGDRQLAEDIVQETFVRAWKHAGRIPELRTTKTLEALRVAVEHELLSAEDANGLAEAWKFASRARNATVQVRGKAADQLPRDARERAAVAAILQYDPGESDVMLNDYLRSARRARGIVDRIFWE